MIKGVVENSIAYRYEKIIGKTANVCWTTISRLLSYPILKLDIYVGYTLTANVTFKAIIYIAISILELT